MPTHLSQTPMPIPASVEDHVHHKLFHDSPSRRTFHDARNHSGFRTPLPRTPHRPQTNDWPLSSAAKSTAPKLIPLISKFETLDADSMGFAVREAQPPHLRLPRSRMGNTKDVDMQQIKSTRKRLLSLFERPGWGAGTLRGFQGLEDAEASVVFDEISYANGRPTTRMERFEDDEPPHLRSWPMGMDTPEKWLGKTKGPVMRDRRESKIKDKIKFFDGSTERHLSHVREMWNRSRADDAVSSNPSSKHSMFSPSRLRMYPQSPVKQPMERRTPIKSYGNLVYRQKRPSQLKTPDWRDRVDRDQLYYQEETPNKSRRNEQPRRPPIIQPYVKETAALRNVHIVHKDPKRKVSEKIEAIYAAGSRERGRQVDSRLELVHRDLSNTSTSALRTASGSRLMDLNNAERELCAAEMTLDTRTKLLSRDGEALLKPRHSNIQDRIKLFSNDGVPIARSEEPVSPLRSYHSGGTLASRPQLLTSKDSSQPNHLALTPSNNTIPQAPLTRTSPTRNIVISMAVPEVTGQPGQLQPELAMGRVLSNTERNNSHINDRIKHFEAFRRVQPARAAKKPINYRGTWPRPKDVGVSAWPQATSENLSKHEIPGRVAQVSSSAKKETNSAVTRASSAKTPLLMQSEKGSLARPSREEDRHRRKINSRQERLARRSRSRCRSTYSQQSPTKDKDKNSQDLSNTEAQVEMEIDVTLDGIIAIDATLDHYHHQQPQEQDHVQEIWIDGHSEEGGQGGIGNGTAHVRENVVAQCVLSHPRPLRGVEMLRMMSLCRRGFEERARGREQERERNREREAERERERERERLRIRARVGTGTAWRRVVGLEPPEGQRHGFMGVVQQRL